LKRCESSRRHKAPFFSVSILTREVGRGSRVPGHRRAAQKKFVTTLCRECLAAGEVRAEGKDLIPCATKE
jgi:hypothetical protein